MRKLTYLAVLEPTKTGYSVFFPDVDGCITVGKDFAEAQKAAKEALELHIYGMEKDGDELPEATNDVSGYPLEQGALVLPVTIFPDLVRNDLDNKAVKTNITLPAWLKEAAEAENVNFSKVMQTALMEYLNLNGNQYAK